MSRVNPLKKHRGMTLLEVILALVIMATSGIAVMNAASGAINNQAHLEDKTLALWVASNGLVELRLKEAWPSETWQQSTETLAGSTWYVRYKGVSTSDSSFKAVDIEVSDVKNGRALAYLRTYIAD